MEQSPDVGKTTQNIISTIVNPMTTQHGEAPGQKKWY